MRDNRENLLYNICKLRIQKFNLEMTDVWESGYSVISTELSKTIHNRENEYKELYGELPKWKTIDDIWAAMKNLEGDKNDRNNNQT
ncbi:MAG: hypothetical protein IJN62_00495 [Clostridia bacterium]|nr:hypothetical protein [Clostridia bacterium]